MKTAFNEKNKKKRENLTRHLFCLLYARGGASVQEEEDSSVMMNVFPLISILHFWIYLQYKQKLESNIQASRIGYEAATLCATSSTRPLARCELSVQ